jgi:PPOX class probable F420-dependent enzyme
MPHHPMTEAEARAFLAADPPHTGKLATTRLDGRPHVAPVWFALDGETLVFTTDRQSLKGRTLRRDPRVALCVDDEAPPFSFVTVEGVVEIGEDLEELRHWATVIGGRYMGPGQAEAYGARNGVAGELLCRLRPTKIVSAKNVAD